MESHANIRFVAIIIVAAAIVESNGEAPTMPLARNAPIMMTMTRSKPIFFQRCVARQCE